VKKNNVLFFLFLACSFYLHAFDSKHYASELEGRIDRVEEFRIIKEKAEELGIRIWLFGGTAAGYAHYVRDDLEREAGDDSYQADRFGYDYVDIFRSTQDADMVVDGDPAKVAELEKLLRERISHFQGSKGTKWELRFLNEPKGTKGEPGYKAPLLDDFDMLNQHTDSHSTGLIEITDPPKGEEVIRDIRDWSAESALETQFFQDLVNRDLHFYFAPNHKETSFYQAGNNPEIISACRFLTKAFQYGLAISGEDRGRIQKIIADFDPVRDLKTDYVKGRLDEVGKRMVMHAVDMEYAIDTLDELGLRKKLRGLETTNKDQKMGVQDLNWWMSKEPLRGFEVGMGRGKTIAQISQERGIPIEEFVVSHETNSFLSWESLTRSTSGKPNVLISRSGGGKFGENSIVGDGHYTKIGLRGARGTGLTIRYVPDSNARKGSDFILSENEIVWTNRNAIQTVFEDLEFDLRSYFLFLMDGNKIDSSNKAVLMKLKRKLYREFGKISDKALQKSILSDVFEKASEMESIPEVFLDEVLSEELGVFDEEFLLDILLKVHCKTPTEIEKKWLNTAGIHYRKVQILSKYISDNDTESLLLKAEMLLKKKHWAYLFSLKLKEISKRDPRLLGQLIGVQVNFIKHWVHSGFFNLYPNIAWYFLFLSEGTHKSAGFEWMEKRYLQELRKSRFQLNFKNQKHEDVDWFKVVARYGFFKIKNTRLKNFVLKVAKIDPSIFSEILHYFDPVFYKDLFLFQIRKGEFISLIGHERAYNLFWSQFDSFEGDVRKVIREMLILAHSEFRYTFFKISKEVYDIDLILEFLELSPKREEHAAEFSYLMLSPPMFEKKIIEKSRKRKTILFKELLRAYVKSRDKVYVPHLVSFLLNTGIVETDSELFYTPKPLRVDHLRIKDSELFEYLLSLGEEFPNFAEEELLPSFVDSSGANITINSLRSFALSSGDIGKGCRKLLGSL